MTIELVQGDTGPQIKAEITREGVAQNLSGATAVLRFRKKKTTSVLFTLSTISSADQLTAGELYFSFTAGQLDIDEGYIAAYHRQKGERNARRLGLLMRRCRTEDSLKAVYL